MLDHAITDHYPISLLTSWSSPKSSPKTISCRSYKNFDASKFLAGLDHIPWQLMDTFDDIDDKVKVFETLFLGVINQHAPLKTIRVKSHPAPCISKPIRCKMDKRNKLLKAFRSNRSNQTDPIKTDNSTGPKLSLIHI